MTRLVFQTVGGAFFVSAAQSAFINQLLLRVPEGVSRLAVIGTGATQLRSVFPGDVLQGILAAYMSGIKTTMAIAVGGVGAALAISLFSNFQRLNKEAVATAGAA